MVPDWTSPFNYLGTNVYITPQPIPIMIPYFAPTYRINCFGSMHNQVNDCNVSSTFAHNSCCTEWQNNDNNLGSRQQENNQDCSNSDVENRSLSAAGSRKPLEKDIDNGEKDHSHVNTEANNGEKDRSMKTS